MSARRPFYVTADEAELVDDALAHLVARVIYERDAHEVSQAPAHRFAGRNIERRVARLRARLAPYLPPKEEPATCATSNAPK